MENLKIDNNSKYVALTPGQHRSRMFCSLESAIEASSEIIADGQSKMVIIYKAVKVVFLTNNPILSKDIGFGDDG